MLKTSETKRSELETIFKEFLGPILQKQVHDQQKDILEKYR